MLQVLSMMHLLCKIIQTHDAKNKTKGTDLLMSASSAAKAIGK